MEIAVVVNAGNQGESILMVLPGKPDAHKPGYGFGTCIEYLQIPPIDSIFLDTESHIAKFCLIVGITHGFIAGPSADYILCTVRVCKDHIKQQFLH